MGRNEEDKQAGRVTVSFQGTGSHLRIKNIIGGAGYRWLIACNHSYLRDRDQENCGPKTTRTNSSQEPTSKKLNTHKHAKQGWWNDSSGRAPA
jgi:hypothetical protein